MDDRQYDATSGENTVAEPKKRKKKRVWRILLILLLSLALIVGMLVGGGYWWVHHTIDSNVSSADDYTDDEVDVTPKDDMVDNVVGDDPAVEPDTMKDRIDRVHNIALFGVDTAEGSVGRSDAMIILSIDEEYNKIKMTSLARDTLVPIAGHGEEKLTHAWAYGHAKLALKTINQSFGMNITDYVYLNFEEFMDVIDYIGGVRLHVNQIELDVINYTPDESLKLPGVGEHMLTGRQALLYSRVRTDSETNRTARQREVLIAMYEQVRKQPASKLPETLKKVLKLCHTNMATSTMLETATWALLNNPTFESLSMPNSQLKPWNGILDNERGWVRIYDLDAAKKVLYNFIYEIDVKVTGVTEYIPAPTTTAVEETTPTTSQ